MINYEKLFKPMFWYGAPKKHCGVFPETVHVGRIGRKCLAFSKIKPPEPGLLRALPLFQWTASAATLLEKPVIKTITKPVV
jgi:hypothetical protein